MNIWTIMFFHNGDTYTGCLYAKNEEEARAKFAKYCPSCSIDRVKKGRLMWDCYTLGPGFEEDMGWNEKEDYELIDSKSVMDSDGFYTDYTLYKDNSNGTYFCMFGDVDLYEPDPDYADETFETEREAIEWFSQYKGFDESLKESWGWNRAKKILTYEEDDISAVAEYLMNRFPDETAGLEAADIKDRLYGLNNEDIKGIDGLPFKFVMEEPEDLDEAVKVNDHITTKVRNHLNKICYKYCGWKYPAEISHLWDELSAEGVEIGIISGMGKVAEDGGKSWEVPFQYNGETIVNSYFIYQVYEGNGDSLKNEYNIYFS